MPQGPMGQILLTIRITVWIQESEVRNPASLDNRKSYQRILMILFGELGCGLETNWLDFGDDPHHYPDSGVRSGSRSDPDPGRTATILLCWRSAEVCAPWVLLVSECVWCDSSQLPSRHGMVRVHGVVWADHVRVADPARIVHADRGGLSARLPVSWRNSVRPIRGPRG